jgi:ribosomal protein L31E
MADEKKEVLFERVIWIDRELNMLIWHRSVRKPPKSIKVRVIKWDDQTVEVDLPEE